MEGQKWAFFCYALIGLSKPLISITRFFKCLKDLYPQAACLICLIKLFVPSTMPFEKVLTMYFSNDLKVLIDFLYI